MFNLKGSSICYDFVMIQLLYGGVWYIYIYEGKKSMVILTLKLIRHHPKCDQFAGPNCSFVRNLTSSSSICDKSICNACQHKLSVKMKLKENFIALSKPNEGDSDLDFKMCIEIDESFKGDLKVM